MERAKFDETWLGAFRKIIGPAEDASVLALRAELAEIGARYRRIIESTPCDLPGAPFNKTLSQRLAWLETSVVKPATRLVDALDAKQQAMFSTWPYEHEFPAVLDRDELRLDLVRLLEFSDRLRRNLQGELAADAGTNQELRAAIYFDILEAMKRHLPNVKPSRGNYDPKFKRYVGKFPEAMRHIYREITGIDDQLVRLTSAFLD